MNQTNNSLGLVSAYALNYLRDKLTLRITHPTGPLVTANWHIRHQKRMGTYEQYSNLVKIADAPFPSSTTIDLSLTRPLGKINLHLHIKNLLNQTYFDKGNIPQPGFWLMAGASVLVFN